jgi:hypothetical protein
MTQRKTWIGLFIPSRDDIRSGSACSLPNYYEYFVQVQGIYTFPLLVDDNGPLPSGSLLSRERVIIKQTMILQ